VKISFKKFYKKTFLAGLFPFISFSGLPIIANPTTYTITLTGNNGADDITAELTGDLTLMNSGYDFADSFSINNEPWIDSLLWSYQGNTYDFSNMNQAPHAGFHHSTLVLRGSDFTDPNWSTTNGAENISNITHFHIMGLELGDVYIMDGFYHDPGVSHFHDMNSTNSWNLTSWIVLAGAAADTGDATYSISGDTYAGSTLTAAVSTDDPDGNGTVTSYTWQSSSDGSTWSDISGATSSTYTVTSVEEGKYIRVTVAYTDGSSTSESVTASSVSISQLHTEWVQPYAAMQNLGLASMKNHRGLVLEKAGECNNYGWQVGDTNYCVYTNAKNTISYVNSSSTKGGYDSAAFNTSLNIEKAINDKWKAGISYGYGSANLDNFNFSGTRANFKSYNSHYYLYGVKKASDKFTLKATFGGSDFDYYGYRNYGTYSSTVANSYYDADAFSGEINGIWNYKKYLNNSTNPIRLRPTAGIAYAIHNQDELSETGTGDLISIDKNQSESLLLKTGITVDRQIAMEKGKWILIPSFGIDLAYDHAADGENTKGVKGKLTNSTTAATHVNAKNFGVVNAVAKLGADIVCTKDLMFSLNATIGVTNKGDQRSYGGGFRWHF